MKYSSQVLADAVDTFARLPGIGKKTALRTILHLAQGDRQLAADIVESLNTVIARLTTCAICHNLSDGEVCTICQDKSREQSLVCVVSGARDVMAIEETNQYKGLYHVLGGVISPIDGIGPSDLHIDSLMARVDEHGVKEVIMALNPTIEGETTIFYLSKQLRARGVDVSVLARGISFGGELEYADELTLGRSILARTPYELNDES